MGGAAIRQVLTLRATIAALLALTTTTHAQFVLFSYDQWERLSIGLQEIYLAGAIDSISTISTPTEVGTAKYYNDCLAKKQITAHTIAEEMKAIVRLADPFYTNTYLGSLCG